MVTGFAPIFPTLMDKFRRLYQNSELILYRKVDIYWTNLARP